MKTNRLNRLLAFSFGFLLVFASACDKHTRIPQSEWRTLNSQPGKQWTVKTPDTMYRAQRFTVTDSTIVLHEVSEIARYDKDSYPPGFKSSSEEIELPIAVPFDELESVELVEASGRRTTLVVLGILATVTIVIVGTLSNL